MRFSVEESFMGDDENRSEFSTRTLPTIAGVLEKEKGSRKQVYKRGLSGTIFSLQCRVS